MARMDFGVKGMSMRIVRIMTGALLLGCAGAAHAATVVIFVEPMTFGRYTRVFDTPGPDQVLMCMAPPSTAGCTKLPIKKTARR
jgi:hypothetical protein